MSYSEEFTLTHARVLVLANFLLLCLVTLIC